MLSRRGKKLAVSHGFWANNPVSFTFTLGQDTANYVWDEPVVVVLPETRHDRRYGGAAAVVVLAWRLWSRGGRFACLGIVS